MRVFRGGKTNLSAFHFVLVVLHHFNICSALIFATLPTAQKLHCALESLLDICFLCFNVCFVPNVN